MISDTVATADPIPELAVCVFVLIALALLVAYIDRLKPKGPT